MNEEFKRHQTRGWWCAQVILALRVQSQEDQKFKVTLDYTGKLRSALAVRDPISKRIIKRRRREKRSKRRKRKEQEEEEERNHC